MLKLFEKKRVGAIPPPPPRPPQIGRRQPRPQPSFSMPTVSFLLDRAAPLNTSLLQSLLQQRHPPRFQDITPPCSKDAPVLFVDGHIVSLTCSDGPCQTDRLDWALHSPHFPQAGEALARHRAHAIIKTSGNATDPLTAARLVTAVAGVFAATHRGVLAGMWNNAVLHSGESWVEMSRAAYEPEPYLPIPLWVNLLLYRDEATGNFDCVTQGLRLFAGRELDLQAGPNGYETLGALAQALITHMVRNGTVLKDGASFPYPGGSPILFRHRLSRRFDQIPVLSAQIPDRV